MAAVAAVAPKQKKWERLVAAVYEEASSGNAAASAAGARLPPPPGDWGCEVALPGPNAARPPPEVDPAASAAAAVQ